jgi:hypothetical protein
VAFLAANFGENRLKPASRSLLDFAIGTILAVKHEPIAKPGKSGIKALLAPDGLIYSPKGILPPSATTLGSEMPKQPHAK